MDIRKIEPEEYTQVLDLRSYSFQSVYNEAKLNDFLHWLSEGHAIGCFEDRELIGQLLILPLNMTLRGQNLAMGGIGFVGTYPEHRNKGIMKAIMINALEQMKSQGQTISVLAPFSTSFYRYFGWELFQEQLQFNCELSDLGADPKLMDEVKRTSFESENQVVWTEIKHFHNTLAKSRNGMMQRSEAWWHRIKARQPDSRFAAFYENGTMVGYIRYTIQNLVFQIDDYYLLHERMEAAVFRFVQAHVSSVTKVEGIVPATRYFGSTFTNPSFEKKIIQPTMFRIVDLVQFFDQVTWRPKTTFLLEIHDQFAPWNEGTFFFSPTEIKKIEGVFSETIRMSINVFSAIIAGYWDVEKLWVRGIITSRRDKMIVLKEEFSTDAPFFNEYF
ncbi:MAG TPA: GNAT family N-acetyltransferase [Kurthia sp.]